jgi:hypothetical protein
VEPRRLQHVGGAHDIHLDGAVGVFLGAGAEVGIGGGVDDAGDAVLVDDLAEVEGVQQVAAEQRDRAYVPYYVRQRGEVGRDVEKDGLLALLHEDARDLGAHQARAGDHGRHGLPPRIDFAAG